MKKNDKVLTFFYNFNKDSIDYMVSLAKSRLKENEVIFHTLEVITKEKAIKRLEKLQVELHEKEK